MDVARVLALGERSGHRVIVALSDYRRMVMLKLCYIEDCWAYFTHQDVKEQQGTGWYKQYYECNASPPGGSKILKIAFCVDGFDFLRPCDTGSYSVEQINRGVVPWLMTLNELDQLNAGATYREFVEFVQEHHGNVYLVCKQEFGEHYEDC